MSVRNGLTGAPDDPEVGDEWSDGSSVFQWTANGWRCTYEPPGEECEVHNPR